MSYTPGPWRVEESGFTDDGHFQEPRIWAEGDGTAANPDPHVAVVRVGLAGSVANARLIAAAPDLLEALKALYPALANEYNDGRFDLLWSKANAAIMKAEGS